MEKFLWCDVETTGLDPKINGIHQIAGQVVVKGVTVEEFDIKFRPADGDKVEKEALAVSDLTIDEVMGRGITSEDAYNKTRRILETHVNKFDKNDKFVFCAYNANFDAQFINEWFVKNDNKYFFGLCNGGAYLDPLNLALLYEVKMGRKVFNPNRKLGTVAKHLGISLDNAHDALADIRATREVGQKLWSMILG